MTLSETEKLVDELAALPAGDERDARLQSLTPEETKSLGEYNADILSQTIARRKELDRQNEKPNTPPAPETPPAPTPDAEPVAPVADDFGKRLREENKASARDVILARLGITDPAKVQTVEDFFKKVDDGSVTQARLEKVWISAAAAAFPEEIGAAVTTLQQMKDNADDFDRQNAGAGSGAGEGGDGKPPVSQDAQDLIKQGKKQGVDFTPEQAEKIEKEGMTRVYQ